MSILVIGPEEETAIKAAIERARRHLIPWSVLQRGAIGTPS
jgi:hypothetical protein